MTKKIVLASANPGKLRELAQILATCHLEVIPQSQFQVPEVAETGLSFVENALIKARHASQYTGLPAFFSQCYAKVFKVEYSGQLMWNIFFAVPIIVSVTAPILFLAEGWRFIFLYSKDDITKHLTDIRDQMSQM